MNAALTPGTLIGIADGAVTLGANLFVQTALVVAAGLVMARLFRRRGPSVESMILRIFLAGAFVCPVLSLAVLHGGLSGIVLTIPLAARTPTVQPAAVPQIPLPTTRVPVKTLVEQPPATAPHRSEANPAFPHPPVLSSGERFDSPAMPPNRHVRLSIVRLPVRAALYISFTVFWAFCTAFMFFRLLTHYGHVALIRRYSIPAKDSFIAACADAARDLGVRPPQVLQSPSVKSPFLAGVVHPRVFLPLGGPEHAIDARTVFLHEVAHLRRRDTAWNLIRHIAVTLVPFQPLLWIMSRRIEETSDYACDDHASAATGNRPAYARSLVAVAESTFPGPSELTAGVGIISASPLRRRIERILDMSRVITLRISAKLLMFVYSLCIAATFIAGLVGIRGTRSFAQISKTSEIVSRKSKEILLSAALAMNERPAAKATSAPPLESPEPEEETAGMSPATSSASSSETIDTPALFPSPGIEDAPIPVTTHLSTEPAGNTPAVRTVTPVPAGIAEERPRIAFVFPATPSNGAADRISGQKQSEPAVRESFHHAQPMPGSISTGSSVAGDLTVASKGEAAYDGLGVYLEKGKAYPVWSPDGRFIAFTGHDGFGIWTVSAGGGEPQLVHDNRGVWGESNMRLGGGHMRTLAFTPDGSGITFVTQIFTIKSSGNTGSGAADYTVYGTAPLIQTLNLKTGGIRILALNADDGSWTPDGSRFVFKQNMAANDCSRPGPIFVLSPGDEDPRPLGVTGAYPRVSPDGRSVVYSTGASLMRVPLSGGTAEVLATGTDIRNPAISPDGGTVMFSSRFGEAAGIARYRLRTLDLASLGVRDIPMNDDLSAEMGAWSPGGKQYCFTATRTAGTTANVIRIADFATTALHSAATPAAPAAFAITGNFPNPFNPATTIEYLIPSDGPVSLEIFNTQGQKVRVLVDSRLSAGKHSAVWNSRDDYGRKVSSGVYIARLKIEGKVESRRMTLLK